MSRYEEETYEEEIDTDEFLGGSLSTSDLEGPIAVTITKTWVEIPANSERRKVHLRFRELAKPLILNVENTQSLRDMFRTKFANRWVGGQFELYVDPTVRMSGKVVGGIRVRPLATQRSAGEPPRTRRPEANGHARAEDNREPSPEYGF